MLKKYAGNYNRVYIVVSSFMLSQRDIIEHLGTNLGSKIEVVELDDIDKIVSDIKYM